MIKDNEKIPVPMPFGENGPTQEEADNLKKEYPGSRVCFIANRVYCVRLMSRSEYLYYVRKTQELMKAEDTEVDLDMEVAEKHLIWPKEIDWNELPGGVASHLSAEVFQGSGFSADRESTEL